MKTKVYILHECIDSADFYAEDNILMVAKEKEKARAKMFELYLDCRSDQDMAEISKDESWCDDMEASVVTNSLGGYYRHHWAIDSFEV